MANKGTKYLIEHFQLEKGKHEFDFVSEPNMFKMFENEEISDPDFKINVVLQQQKDQFVLYISAKGKIKIQCDRCLDFFNFPIDMSTEILVKLGDETNFDLNEDYVLLDRESKTIDIAYFIYEMIILGLPVKRVHPHDENGNPTCNPEVTKYIDGESEFDATQGSDNPPNEKWKDQLRDLLN